MNSRAPESLETSVGFLITKAARSVKRELDERLTAYKVTSTQFITLSVLWEGDGITLTELGRSLYFDNPTMTGIIDRLERDGLVERQRDTEDRRSVKVFLTNKGKRLQNKLTPIANEVNQIALKTFSKKEKMNILSIFTQIWLNMNRDTTKGIKNDQR